MKASSWTGESRPIHPLQIYHIVERILEREILQSQLLELRQVCHVWNQIASRCHRKCSKQSITFGKNFLQISKFNDHLNKSNTADVFPLGNFKFCPEIFKPEHEESIHNFFLQNNLMLSSLEIRLDSHSTLCFKAGWFSDVQLPRLKRFLFDDRRNPASNAYDNIFHVLLKASGNSLETLSIYRKQIDIQENEDGDNAQMMDRICTTFKSANLRHLKNLHVDLVMNDEFLNCLSSTLYCNLTSLSLSLKTSNFSRGSFHNLLQSQEATLQKLRLGGLCKKSQLQIHFPTLRNLQSMEIQGWCHNIPHVEFTPFSISQNFPNLTDLILNTWSINQPSWRQFLQCNNNNALQESLMKIKLPQEMLEVQLVSDISSTFKNIKVLTLHFQPCSVQGCTFIFEKVFQTLATLEELTILQSFCEFPSLICIDSLLTGLPVEECMRMLCVNNFSGVIESANEAGMRRPSLINLKNLKCLDLSDVLKRQAMITDVTGYMLHHMSSLKHLKILTSGIKQNCFYQLFNKFPIDLKEEMNLTRILQRKSLENEDRKSSSFGNCLIM